jgi:hypothetical protein
VVLLVGIALAVVVAEGAIVVALAVVATLSRGYAYVSISATEYRFTRQRIEITGGVFSQQVITRSLYEFGDAAIRQSLRDRLFGVGDLSIVDRRGGTLVLRAIRDPVAVREIVRSHRQFEAARFENTAGDRMGQWR